MLLDASLFHDRIRRMAALDAGRHREVAVCDWAIPDRMAPAPDPPAIMLLQDLLDLSVEGRGHLRWNREVLHSIGDKMHFDPGARGLAVQAH
jgi:hypothetical protein